MEPLLSRNNMGELSPELGPRAHNIEGQLLRAIAHHSQRAVADQLGIDASTMSRWLETEAGLARACALIAALKFRLIDETTVVHDAGYVAALETLARRQLDQRALERG